MTRSDKDEEEAEEMKEVSALEWYHHFAPLMLMLKPTVKSNQME